MMPYYHTCPHCSANLDPGERCDCTKEKTVPEESEDGHNTKITQ